MGSATRSAASSPRRQMSNAECAGVWRAIVTEGLGQGDQGEQGAVWSFEVGHRGPRRVHPLPLSQMHKLMPRRRGQKVQMCMIHNNYALHSKNAHQITGSS